MLLEKCQNLRRVNLTLQNLAQLRKDFKNFSLVSFGQWRVNRHVTKTWQKIDIKHNKYYQWPEYWLDGFVHIKPSSYAEMVKTKKQSLYFSRKY